MADYFYDGMPNVNERLNQLYGAFSAGPYNALPLTGGTLRGALTIDQRPGSAVIALIGAAASSRGGVIYGIRGEAYTFAIGNESASRGGDSAALVLDSISDEMKFYCSGGARPVMQMDVARIEVARNVLPAADNVFTLGNSAQAYSVVYARTGAINTSDARLKCDFRDLTGAEIAAARDLAHAIGVYRWRDAVAAKDGDAREHVGPTVQRAIEIMRAHGLDPFNYGFICHDEWAQEVIDHPAIEARPAADGLPELLARAAWTEVLLEAGDRYAFRYDELAMFIAAGQEARLTALEAAV